MQALSHVHVGCARSTLARPASSVEPVLGLHVQRGAPPPLAEPELLGCFWDAEPGSLQVLHRVTLFPQPRRLSYLTSSSSFAFFAFSSLLFSSLLLCRSASTKNSTLRITPVAASGHAIEAAEPISAILDFHHRLSRSASASAAVKRQGFFLF